MSAHKIMTSFLAPEEGHFVGTPKLKLAVLGDKQVGKTSLVTRYIQGTFSHTYLHTKGGDIAKQSVSMNGKSLHLTIIDSAGHRYVRSLIKTLYRNVHGIMIVYDVTMDKTFESIQEWLKQIALVNTGEPFIMMVGNKNDLQKHKRVPNERAMLYAAQNNIPFKEVSAKTGEEVKEAFAQLIEGTCIQKLPSVSLDKSIKLTENDEKFIKPQESSCCSR